MTPEEKAKTVEQLQKVRQEIDAMHSEVFTIFVDTVHSLSLMLAPFVKNQQVLAYKLTELESKLREEVLG